MSARRPNARRVGGRIEPISACKALANGMGGDGGKVLRKFFAHFHRDADRCNALVLDPTAIAGDLTIGAGVAGQPTTDCIGAVICMGDLRVTGDIINDHVDVTPFLVVTGSLYVRGWLRGGMASFIFRDVHATGYLVGEYEDGNLFVGGDLHAMGYVLRRKPFHDMPKMKPHQIYGRVLAKTFDATRECITDRELEQTFVDGALSPPDPEGRWYDSARIMEYGKQGKSIWRSK